MVEVTIGVPARSFKSLDHITQNLVIVVFLALFHVWRPRGHNKAVSVVTNTVYLLL